MTDLPECGPGTGVDCGEVLDNLAVFLDGELPESEIAALSEHLAACYPCTDRRDFERQLRAHVKECCSGERAPESLLEKVRARLSSASTE